MKQNLHAHSDDAGKRPEAHLATDGPRLPAGRILLFYLLWMVLAGAGTPELWVGVPAAVLSGWLSAKLLPTHGLRWRPMGLLSLCALFVRDSIVAGWEIALLILRPNLRIAPGFVSHRTHIPGEAMLGFYKSYNSLTPGTLAVEPEADGSLIFHCLDVRNPVAESLAANEVAILRAIDRGRGGALE
jgi:multicomponent Na+:H+ antiporter subunit E